jgi:hypothetical protein
MFDASTLGSDDMMTVRNKALKDSQTNVEALLSRGTEMEYDALVAAALSQPFTWESDLKEWLRTWAKAGKVTFSGLQPTERTPKLRKGHLVRWH